MLATTLFLGITITLAPSARVRGNDIELREIASVSGASATEEATLADLVLGAAPTPGFARTLTRERIALDVARTLPDAAVTWSGVSACKIDADSETISSAVLAACAEAALREVFGARDVEIRLESAPTDLVVPIATSAHELRAVLGSKEPRGGSWSVGVQAWIDGAPYRAAWVTYRVDLFDRKAVLARDVKRGETIGERDLEEARVRVDTMEHTVERSTSVGALAARDLARGTALVDRDVIRPKLVERGDLVELSITKGSIVARVAAFAAQDGRLGERIRVATADKRRELVVIVSGPKTVAVDLGSARALAPNTP